MDGKHGEVAGRPARGRGLFSWAFYLFGTVVTSMTFALLMQFLAGPDWGERHFRGWIDPSLNLFVIPSVGAALGLALTAIANIISILARGRSGA